MSNAEQTWANFFVALAFTAHAIVAIALLAGAAALVSRSVRAGLGHVVDVVGSMALPLSFGVAVVATWGSLFYSEFAGFTPCVLCWYQRFQ